MELLIILLIFALGVFTLGGCFLAGIAFVFKTAAKFLETLFRKGD